MSSTVVSAEYANRREVKFTCPFCNAPHSRSIALKQFPKEGDLIPVPIPCASATDFGFKEFIVKITKNTVRPVFNIFNRNTKTDK